MLKPGGAAPYSAAPPATSPDAPTKSRPAQTKPLPAAPLSSLVRECADSGELLTDDERVHLVGAFVGAH